jgi:hypothetical protein
MIGTLPTGTRGFDCNVVVSGHEARAFASAGYRYAIRYVPRVKRRAYDLSARELDTLLWAGLAVMVVQHVALPGWVPDGPLGTQYGLRAAEEAQAIGYEPGAVLWCDLEEVKWGTPAADVIEYCNRWFDAVKAGGYQPGLYVGYGAVLDAKALYYRLKFARYWSAYNLNRDQYPAVRGVQLRQFAKTAADRVPGIRWEYDVNLIGVDAKGDSPVLMLASGDR